MRSLLFVSAALVAACAGGSSGWSAAMWNGLPDRTVAGGNYAFLASPMEGQGFKLKFSIKTDGNFGVASGEPITDETLIQAAKAATPEGCTFVSLERAPDGGAVADYDCDEA